MGQDFRSRFASEWSENIDRMFLYLRLRGLAEENAQDTLQETALVILEKSEEIDEIIPYAYGVMNNLLVASWRKVERSKPRSEDESMNDYANSVTSASLKAMRKEAIDALLNCSLDEGERELIIQKWVLGFSNQEIANQLGVTTTACGTSIHRLKTRLQSELGALPDWLHHESDEASEGTAAE